MGLFRSRVAAGSRLIWYKVGSGTDRACRAVGATVHCSTERVPARSVPGRPVFRHGKCRTPPCSGTVRGGTRRRLRFCTEVLGFWPTAATSKNAFKNFKTRPTRRKRHYIPWPSQERGASGACAFPVPTAGLELPSGSLWLPPAAVAGPEPQTRAVGDRHLALRLRSPADDSGTHSFAWHERVSARANVCVGFCVPATLAHLANRSD